MCSNCTRPLKISQYSKDGNYKSCPKCSTDNGKEHVFYPVDHFGYTDLRITGNNPNGIQSWCPPCRGKVDSTSSFGLLCSQIKI